MTKRSGNRDADKTIQVLFEISSALNSASTLDALYKSIHKSLSKILNVENIYIALYHEDKDSITFPYHVDKYDDLSTCEISYLETSSLTNKVLEELKPVFFKKEELETRAKQKGILGTIPLIWMGAPLIIRGEVKGVLAVQSYTDPDLYDLS
ncbi:MAG: GAF domain-containing protein, partial [Desulfobacteraceae bacterium]|nr:GAF domain-containing protein [Desulfobacteraceae bacterium]